MKVAVFGASGYGGQILMRLLLDHPEVSKVLPVSSTSAGKPVDGRDSGLGPDLKGKLPEGRTFLSREEALEEKPDAVFSALPHGASAEFCEPFFGKSVVFDLSADFRLRDEKVHLQAYGAPAPYPELRSAAVYGLSEIYETQIRKSDLIAVPGCYPTCSMLPLIPLGREGLITSTITINSLSGISGAGRSAKEASLFVERSENSVAYNPGLKHRHLPEMIQEFNAAGGNSPIFFTPHLAPMRRGMLSTISTSVTGEPKAVFNKVEAALTAAYQGQPFINLTGNRIPSTRDVVGSNRCDIGWTVEGPINGSSMLYLFSTIDNLVKGASGQAVQDFNIRFGFPQETGLSLRSEV
ncbi:MAG: N-acetyl-gamma-glutamyl-phosphate reductase [Spirochaetes bacterium]|nr:MAG: N-acetyl-gamma-glutamyl-phosphate reductase [Spirochaetota bacterium]